MNLVAYVLVTRFAADEEPRNVSGYEQLRTQDNDSHEQKE